LLVEAVETGRRVLGEVHPKVGNYTRNLARLYSRQRRYSETEELLLEAITIRRRELSDENLDTRRCISLMLHIYREWNRPDKAKEFQATLSKVVGEDR
jgi:hypothetical protein